MTRHRLTDEEIAQALLQDDERRQAPGGGTRGPVREAGARGSCVHEDRLWDLARGALDPDLTGEILDHTVKCPDCSLALRVAHETFAASGMPPEARHSKRPLIGMWSRLAGSILRPVPAFAYLVLLILSFPIYRALMPPAGDAGVPPSGSSATSPPVSEGGGLPAGDHPIQGGPSETGGIPGASRIPAPNLRSLRVLRLTGDLSLRNGQTQLAPVRVHLGEAEALVLKLFPDVEDLPKSRGAALLVRVLDGESVVVSTIRRVSDLEGDQSLSLLLDGARLRPGTTYSVEVTTTLALAGSGGAGPSAGSHLEAPPAPPILKQSFRLD